MKKKQKGLSTLLLMEVHGIGWQSKVIQGTQIMNIKILHEIMDKPVLLAHRRLVYS